MTGDEAKASLRAQLTLHGETVTFKRYSGTGASRTSVTDTALCRVMEFKPEEMIGIIQQGDRKLVVMAEDLETGSLTMPLRKGDKAVVRSRELNIEAVDDNTRRIGSTLVGYELVVRG